MLNKLTEINKNLAPMAFDEIEKLLLKAQTNLICFKGRWYSVEEGRLFVVGNGETFENKWDDYDYFF